MKARSLTHGNFKAALSSIRGARGRSFLTMLGIIIGIVSVVTIVSIGEGVKQQVSQQVEHLGHDLIIVRPGTNTASGGSSMSLLNTLEGTGLATSITDKDVQTMRQTPGVGFAVPLSLVAGSVTGDHSSRLQGPIVGTTPELPKALNQTLTYGGFFDDSKESSFVVLGQQAAARLFDENVPLGRELNIRGQSFVVGGIFGPFDTAPLSIDLDFNNAIFVSYGAAQELTNHSAPIYEVLVRPKSPDQTDTVVASLKRSLGSAHGSEQDFSVMKQQESLAATNRILTLLTRLIAGVAAISLFVGGVGIMNVMLVSVTERMHEIGVRKAVGATNRQILNEFVTEAAVLSFAGGVIGIIVASLIDLLFYLFTDLQPVITWQVVLLAFGVSIVVGILFGSAPALKAARKNPIDALRNE